MEVTAASEESNSSKIEDKNMIDVNDITECEINEETMIELTTVKSKDDNDTVVDKVIKGNVNIGEALAVSKEALLCMLLCCLAKL